MSTIRTFSPIPARYAARLIAVVLFPTPPFWFTMATTMANAGILARLCWALPLCDMEVSSQLYCLWESPPNHKTWVQLQGRGIVVLYGGCYLVLPSQGPLFCYSYSS